MQSIISFSDIMSEFFNVYYASNSIDVLTSINYSFDAERSNANQSNAITIISNASSSNAEFELLKTQMRKFFAKNKIIEIDFKRYIKNHFQIYFEKLIYDYNLWILITKKFEIFIINVWILVFSNLWITIYEKFATFKIFESIYRTERTTNALIACIKLFSLIIIKNERLNKSNSWKNIITDFHQLFNNENLKSMKNAKSSQKKRIESIRSINAIFHHLLIRTIDSRIKLFSHCQQFWKQIQNA